MAQTKYWRLRLKGELSPDQVSASLPEHAMNILRIHTEGGETQVYYAATEQPGAPKLKARAGEGAEEVSLDAVTKIG